MFPFKRTKGTLVNYIYPWWNGMGISLDSTIATEHTFIPFPSQDLYSNDPNLRFTVYSHHDIKEICYLFVKTYCAFIYDLLVNIISIYFASTSLEPFLLQLDFWFSLMDDRYTITSYEH